MRRIPRERNRVMTEDDLTAVRVRAAAAGLELDEDRIRILAASLEGVQEMMETMEWIEIDPLDLALDAYQPAWSEGGRG
jgi:ribosomal protein L12E/L44/L45/RPP1/RPP2